RYGAIQRFGTPTTIATSGPYAGQAEIRYDIGNTWLTDLEVSYHWSDHLAAALTANHLFDEKVSRYPGPLVPRNMAYYYATGGPVDASGGFYSARLQWQW